MARDDNSERHAEGDRQQHGYADEPNVFERRLPNFALMLNKEINEAHWPSRLPRTSENSQRTQRPRAPEPTKTPWPKRFPPTIDRRARGREWQAAEIRLHHELPSQSFFADAAEAAG